jgi:uncharacterized protein
LGLAVKIAVDRISETPKDIKFSEDIEELNLIYKEEQARDFHFPPFLDVNMVYYRSGREIFFQGRFGGTIEGFCGRCLRSYSFPIEKDFDFVLTSESFASKRGELNQDEMGLSFCAAEEINISPFIREQVLLALPMRPLCEDDCRGLCAGCGVNLNEEPCLCSSSPDDPRMALFRALKLGR